MHAASAALGPVPWLEFVRGDVLARLGRHAEAEKALREEIQAFPSHARAYASLAIVTALQGRPLAESRSLLVEMNDAGARSRARAAWPPRRSSSSATTRGPRAGGRSSAARGARLALGAPRYAPVPVCVRSWLDRQGPAQSSPHSYIAPTTGRSVSPKGLSE